MSSCVPITILLCLLVSHSMGNTQKTENAKKYMTNVVKRMVAIIESNPISGDAFPMREFESTINVTMFGLTVIGTIHFHSGFVAKMESAELVSTSHQNRITDTASTISALFRFALIQTVYDVRYDLQDFKEYGAFTLLYTDIIYAIEIKRQHSDRVVTPTIEWDKVNYIPGPIPGPFRMIAKGYPDNGYTQLVCREMKHKVLLRIDLESSFNDWASKTLQPALRRAVGEYAFPEIIYYSN